MHQESKINGYLAGELQKQLYIGPEHLSSSSRKSWTPQHERKRDGEEKSDAALARIFDDPFFPSFSIGGSTNASCAGAACVKHSNGVFRHKAPVNVRVCLREFLHTIPESTP